MADIQCGMISAFHCYEQGVCSALRKRAPLIVRIADGKDGSWEKERTEKRLFFIR